LHIGRKLETYKEAVEHVEEALALYLETFDELQPPILCHSPTNDFEGDPYPTHYPDVREPPYDAHDAPPVEPSFLPESPIGHHDLRGGLRGSF
jgi:hypothetical protein